ncbi:glycosyltransferase [Alkalilimnicola ehrlichii MLHE-1]|uniref:glycosyltransferase n=1 Tax=Alkalilimnicola ehrlichii TaxID=351052 RepID=UPI000311334B
MIVPVYRQWDAVRPLLRALEAQSLGLGCFEVVLVDNAPAPCPPYPQADLDLRVIHCPRPGAYAARNAGLADAAAPVLAFTDADCRPGPDWLAEGLRVLNGGDPGPDLVAGAIALQPADPARPNLYEQFDLLTGMRQARYARRGYGATANLLVRRAVFEVVGPFDAGRYSGGDAEFCRRAVAAGHALHYAAGAVVAHPARDSWPALAAKARRVKGGQIVNGPYWRRALWLLRTLAPPVDHCARLLRHPRPPAAPARRLRLCGLRLGLWGVELAEVIRLSTGGRPRRG